MSVNMQVSLGGLLMKNAVTTASGTFASGKEYAQFFDVSRLGAITTKGLSLNGWAGNDTPRIGRDPFGHAQLHRAPKPGRDGVRGKGPSLAARGRYAGHRERFGSFSG